MNIKDCKRTKGGHLVEIFATDGGGKYPIQGRVWEEKEEKWLLLDWKLNGEFSDYEMFNREYSLDLYDWKKDIPWDALKDEIQYVATDIGGGWYGYKRKPFLDSNEWKMSEDEVFGLRVIKMPTPPCWRESLVKRPDRE